MRIRTSQTIDELITAFSFIIDVEGNRKLYHAWRVAALAYKFSQKLTARERRNIFYASLLHDVGGVGLTKHITYFLKQETKKQQTTLFPHPIIGAQMVSTIPNMNPCAKLILDHHEWLDGSGYPRAKSGKSILRGAQIIRTADSVDIALRNSRYNNLGAMKARLRQSADKEASRKICKSAINALGRKNFFRTILNPQRIPEIFYEIKEKINPIPVNKGIDAIGKTLEVMAQIIDMKHPFTAGHSLRVSHYAMATALAMRLEHDEVTRIRWAALIHDVGKLSLSRKILDKPTSLSKDEFAIVKRHPEITRKILEMVPTLKEIIPIAAGHHEYFNGGGYPLGLKSNQSLLGARILVVCDAFDAMTSNRPYRKPRTSEIASREIKKLAGKQFDPAVVKYAFPLFKNLGL